MKVKDVPQDQNESYEGHSKIRYAKSEDGSIVKVKSSGWKVEEDATSLAWDDIHENLKSVYFKVEANELSPLAYRMEEALLTADLLAQNLGYWTFTVKRHLKPKVFNGLNEKKLMKYCDYFEITLEELKTLPKDLPWK
ncbi:hypothetical protein A9Q84_05505 [Halobacteriovorax marinus]|uniref:HTH cro/C1-type domain-containing protein n=1 Tax=Halobacteriovorax marinus TaxID=97084 RepID=A0A1Y5FB11_9BACT|nr:hypothetical protein A9Q84_05505 [Halobacteriovorax marinus]